MRAGAIAAWRRAGDFALFLFAILLLRHFAINPSYQQDTRDLIDGARALLGCWGEGKWNGCPGAQHFAAFQYLLAAPLAGLGFSDQGVLRAFAGVSSVAFFGTALFFYRGLKALTGDRIALFGVLTFLAGPFIVYGSASFNEMTAALVTLLAAGAVVFRRPAWMIAALFALGGITKEVAPPFMFLIGAAALLVQGKRPKAHEWLSVVAGVAIAIILNGSFNLLRFKTWGNASTLDPTTRVNEIGQWLGSFAALWFSPNGGVAVFWPGFVLVIVVAVFAVAAKKASPEKLLGFGALAAILFGLTSGFSLWFAPMGWVAWGPRLMLPWLPAILFLILASFRDEVEAALRAMVSSRPRAMISLGVLIILALPHAIAALEPSVLHALFETDATCPVRARLEDGPAEYFRCLNHLFWTKRWVFLDAVEKMRNPRTALFAASFAAALAALAARVAGAKARPH